MKTQFYLTLLCCLFFNLQSVKASKFIVSQELGFDPTDNTSNLQFALSGTTEDTIIIDNTGMDWNTGPLFVSRNNFTVILEEGVVLRALPNVFDVFDSMITLIDKSDINIIGYGASIIMNKEEYINLADSEFRHGILHSSAINILIEGLEILDSGGDGVLISRSFQANSPQNYCENVVVKNCRMSNNYRQGLSLTSGKDIQILNCEFSNTNGTLPEDGIDIEPDLQSERVENVLIKGCRIFNNNGNAIQFALLNLDDNSVDVSITVEDTYMANNHDPANAFVYAEIAATDNGENGVNGFVDFKNCFIESSEWTAVYIAKTVESYTMNFENCVFKDVSNNSIAFNNPIFFEVTDYANPVPRYGGANFTDCTIIYDEDIPFLSQIGNAATSDGLGDVNGNIFIVNTNDAGFDIGNNPNNVNITYQYYSAFPSTEVSLSAAQLDYLESDSLIVYEATRSANPEIPVAISTDFDGIAQYGMDYDRGKGFVLFEAGNLAISDTIAIVMDTIEEASEIFDMNLLSSDCLIIGNDSMLTFSINDDINTAVIEYELSDMGITVFPNPSQNLVSINALSSNFDIRIFDVNGQTLKSYYDLAFTITIDTNHIPSGTYFIEIKNKLNNQVEIERFLKM